MLQLQDWRFLFRDSPCPLAAATLTHLGLTLHPHGIRYLPPFRDPCGHYSSSSPLSSPPGLWVPGVPCERPCPASTGRRRLPRARCPVPGQAGPL